MKPSTILSTTFLVPVALAYGEGTTGPPESVGIPRDLDTKVPTTARVLRYATEPKRDLLETRQGGQDGRCGPSFGGASCDAGFCCSGAGYCGTTKDHCSAPNCLVSQKLTTQVGISYPNCRSDRLRSGLRRQ